MKTSVWLMAAALVCGPASAQERPAEAPHPAQTDKVIPEKQAPESDAARGGQSLSEKLDKTDGVIAPPDNVDPAIRTPVPPAPSNMPVIKPLPNTDMDGEAK